MADIALAPSLAGRYTQAHLRNAGLFVLSVLGIYVLQPAMPIRQMDFWLPTVALLLAVVVWAATAAADQSVRALIADGSGIAVLVLGITGTRYIEPLSTLFTRTPAPDVLTALLALAFGGAVALLIARLIGPRPGWTWGVLAALVALLVALKVEPLTQALAGALRAWQGQSVAAASALDVRWLGFSYLFFRLVAALRERAAGRLPRMSLREFITYALFAPAWIAGPIDRPERFLKDLRADFRFNLADSMEGGRRVAVGAFKKFVLADLLALFALNEVNALQVRGAAWAWLLLYAYALRIYFDFGGYSDIAIGIARVFGIRLPENFSRPYLKPNLTQFWNSWHISLAQWFRAYYFNPLTRALRTRGWPAPAIILTGQLTTMLLIGLWHGVTWNFAIWGAWHGLGLFIHNRWADFARARAMPEPPASQRALGAALTFHFVALGWVWFALPDPALAWRMIATLFGL